MSNELEFWAQCYWIEILTLNYSGTTLHRSTNILTHGYLYYQNDLDDRSQELNKALINIGCARRNDQRADHTVGLFWPIRSVYFDHTAGLFWPRGPGALSLLVSVRISSSTVIRVKMRPCSVKLPLDLTQPALQLTIHIQHKRRFEERNNVANIREWLPLCFVHGLTMGSCYAVRRHGVKSVGKLMMVCSIISFWLQEVGFLLSLLNHAIL